MDIAQWLEVLKRPADLTPRMVMEGYIELSAYYAEKHVLSAELTSDLISIESQYLEKGFPSSKAKTCSMATEQGKKQLIIKGQLKALEEIIRALKKAQQHYENEGRNVY
jgi:hypothetical protein